jgi:hypothetical protein
MKKVLLLAGLALMTGYVTMAQQHHPKKDSTGTKPAHVKEPKKASDTTHHAGGKHNDKKN